MVSTWVEEELLYQLLYQPWSFASNSAKVFLADIFAACSYYVHLILASFVYELC